tara:strand:- start:99 stop:1193 length:1095 start_codon:yes stop_codon:yes gene_type:complete
MTKAAELAKMGEVLTNSQIGGRRNIIINGAMVHDQRNGGSAIASLGQYSTYTVDRWKYYSDQSGKFSFQQNQSSVTPPVGFTKYLGLTSLSDFSPGTNESVSISQYIEGFNSAQLNWGTSDAKTCTLSFYVRSSLTGTFSGALVGGQNYIFTYSVSSANTWEYKTITIPGSTTGTWNTDNTSGVRVLFTLGYGSGQVGTANAWQSADLAASGSIQVAGTSGATFYITGVQLEVGSQATPFEHRSFGEELALCQRYYYKTTTGANAVISGSATATGTVDFSGFGNFPVRLRTTPTALEQSGTASHYRWNGATGIACSSVPSFSSRTTSDMWQVNMGVASGLTVGRSGTVVSDSSGNGYFAWSAEL